MSENDCVFCNAASGKQESEIMYQEEGKMAFHGVGGSLTHVLVMSRDHVASPEEIGRLPEDVGKHTNIAESGHAVRTDTCSYARQEIFHPHAYVGGGTKIGMV